MICRKQRHYPEAWVTLPCWERGKGDTVHGTMMAGAFSSRKRRRKMRKTRKRRSLIGGSTHTHTLFLICAWEASSRRHIGLQDELSELSPVSLSLARAPSQLSSSLSLSPIQTSCGLCHWYTVSKREPPDHEKSVCLTVGEGWGGLETPGWPGCWQTAVLPHSEGDRHKMGQRHRKRDSLPWPHPKKRLLSFVLFTCLFRFESPNVPLTRSLLSDKTYQTHLNVLPLLPFFQVSISKGLF